MILQESKTTRKEPDIKPDSDPIRMVCENGQGITVVNPDIRARNPDIRLSVMQASVSVNRTYG